MSILAPLYRLLFIGLLAAATPALAATPIRASSPDNVLSVEVATDGDGRASYAITRLGKPVIAPSKLGFLFVDAPKFDRSLVASDLGRRSVDETWEQPWGEWRYIRNHFNELRVGLTEAGGLKRRIDVVFRLYD
ncbi:MAG: alpha-glucosidase, partial [Phenylobacterium sp.]|uniref:glycoside hydrolase family 97 N-terminal domain-containing protein n=1 Tax=Phenylobacterium sp. TaxID=1871053 RepID=UPI00260BDFB5